jgi:Raf kinase inhibitor-like YbhB/YbcL family protein
MPLQVTSAAFAPGAVIPRQYTGDGADRSPPLQWAGAPPQTKEFALIADDPDAPQAEPWVHWVLYKIPASVTQLPEGIAPKEQPDAPGGAAQGKNTFGKIGYGGPAPPRGHGVHHYHFKVYALDAPLNVKPGLDKKTLLAAMSGHVVAEGEMVGTYQR